MWSDSGVPSRQSGGRLGGAYGGPMASDSRVGGDEGRQGRNDTGPAGSSKRAAMVQDTLDNSFVTMKMNMERLAERGEQVESLVGKSDNLSTTSSQFNRQSTQLSRHFFLQKWRNCFFGSVVVLLLLCGLYYFSPRLFLAALITGGAAFMTYTCYRVYNSYRAASRTAMGLTGVGESRRSCGPENQEATARE